MKRIFS